MYEFVEKKIDRKFREHYNVHEKTIYSLLCDGKEVFKDTCFTSKGESDLNDGKRFVILAKYETGTYSEDIVKHCKLKHSGSFFSYECVFDKEKNEIVLETSNRKFDQHIQLCENIAELDGEFIYLPTGKTILSSKYGICEIWKTESFLFVREGYNSPVNVIGILSGEIQTYR